MTRRSRPTPQARCRVVWPDGGESAARFWEELLLSLADDQLDDITDEELRHEMAFRAKVWSDTRINHEGTARAFFYELERARMLQILEDPDVD